MLPPQFEILKKKFLLQSEHWNVSWLISRQRETFGREFCSFPLLQNNVFSLLGNEPTEPCLWTMALVTAHWSHLSSLARKHHCRLVSESSGAWLRLGSRARSVVWDKCCCLQRGSQPSSTLHTGQHQLCGNYWHVLWSLLFVRVCYHLVPFCC